MSFRYTPNIWQWPSTHSPYTTGNSTRLELSPDFQKLKCIPPNFQLVVGEEDEASWQKGSCIGSLIRLNLLFYCFSSKELNCTPFKLLWQKYPIAKLSQSAYCWCFGRNCVKLTEKVLVQIFKSMFKFPTVTDILS